MKSLAMRVSENEKSCQFSKAESKTNKKDFKAAKEEIKNLRNKCNDFEKVSKSLQTKIAENDKKMIDLESKSMR